MSVKVTDLLQWAQGTPYKSEAGIRAAISRAYYAAYHKCLEWEKTLKHTGNPHGSNSHLPGVHQQLINRLQQPSPNCSPTQQQLSRQLGIALESLKADRFVADYELHKTLAPRDANHACSAARTILVQAKPVP